jgi:hypothetical protein
MRGDWFFSVVFAIISLSFIAIGLRGLLTRKPFMLPARWLFWLMLLCFSPALVLGIQSLFDDRRGPGSSTLLMQPLVFLVVLVMMWIQMKGYLVYGITDESFRNALHYALQKLDLPHEEKLTQIRLTTVGADLQVAVQSWMGSGQIRIKPSQHAPTLKRIADQMSEYFATTPVQTNMVTSAFYAIMGVLLLVMAVVLVNLLRLPHRP